MMNVDLLRPVVDHIKVIQDAIPGWQHAASTYGVISWTVFLIGIVVSALQLRKGKWTAGAVAALGLAVAGLTGFLERGFPCDRRTYLASVLDAQQTIRDLQTAMNNYASDPDLQSGPGVDEGQMYRLKLDFLHGNIEPLDKHLNEIETKLVASAWTPDPLAVYAATKIIAGTSATGAGECNVGSQARENSHAAAVEKLTALVAKMSGLTPTPAERELLRAYVVNYATKSEGPETGAQTSTGFTRYQTTLTLSATYTNPSAVRAFVTSQHQGDSPASRQAELDALVQRAAHGPAQDGLLVARGTVGQSGGSLTLESRAGGVFTLRFAMDRRGATSMLSLDGIDISDDGSAGSTRWSFDVLQQGRIVFSVPTQRWDDSHKPTLCTIDPSAQFSGAVSLTNGAADITVVGLKPKVSESR